MKRTVFVSVSALFLLSLTASQLATAQTGGPYARGSYRFILEEDDLAKLVEFDARTDERGVSTGAMTFADQARISDIDDVEAPPSDNVPPEFYIKAELDALVIDRNRAVMSGTVRESSHRSYLGKWVQLVVEDNRDLRLPDRLTWGLCKPQPGGWVPSDAERRDDQGAYLRWWATDAERRDDVGVASPNLISSEERGCRVYQLDSYSFVDIRKWEGDIVVQP